MTDVLAPTESLYRARRKGVEIVDVPSVWFVLVRGDGPADGDRFRGAADTVRAVTRALRYLTRQPTETMMPLEALWWNDQGRVPPVPVGAPFGDFFAFETDQPSWQWQVMIAQPGGVDEAVFGRAIERVGAARPLPALAQVRAEPWREGWAAQVLHVGPFAAGASDWRRLGDEIAARGYRPVGRRHEIYRTDPDRTPPGASRILRQPIEPA